MTSSDIEFNVTEIDFGFCTVFESVRQTITITNKSVVPQPFGFCGVPDVSKINSFMACLLFFNFHFLINEAFMLRNFFLQSV